jgi:hypothetical protein
MLKSKKMKNLKAIKENVRMIKSIINDVLDSEDQRNDDENFFAVLDRLEIIQKLLNPNQK